MMCPSAAAKPMAVCKLTLFFHHTSSHPRRDASTTKVHFAQKFVPFDIFSTLKMVLQYFSLICPEDKAEISVTKRARSGGCVAIKIETTLSWGPAALGSKYYKPTNENHR